MGVQMTYAEVYVDISSDSTDRPFHYLIPESLRGHLAIGQRVIVPFGHRRVEGVVVGFSSRAPVEGVKAIDGVLEPSQAIGRGQVGLSRWLAARYICTLPQALRCVIPPGARRQRVRPAWQRLVGLPDGLAKRGEDLLREVVAPKQRDVVKFLVENPGGYTRAELSRLAGTGPAAVRALIQKGLLVETVERRWRRTLLGEDRPKAAPTLTPEQNKVLDAVYPALESGGHEVFLLHGVTGSGKTEVYMRVVEAALKKGRQGIVLVPEIALTPQLKRVFGERFGDRVAILHSALSAGERYDQWEAIREGEVDVVLGARSAVFAPFPDLGVVIVDEEHETSYKQDESPRYHAREVAIERARRAGATVILGSATPSLESYQQAVTGRYRLLEMSRRVDNRPLPRVEVVDMRVELARGNRSIFSERMALAIEDRLHRREQVLLFLNRRGFHTFVLCRECGNAVKCHHCDVALTLHLADCSGPLRCHYCQYQRDVPALCPHCGGSRIRYFGTGTQRVEELVKQRFPGARVLRMDVDTTGKRGAHERIYESFRSGEADILIGTQMVAKGWDISGVTLVGVISADTSLHLPDFRGSERTFQLLTQVAGRAGRGEIPGEVVIQTYSPEHYAIQAAALQDYRAFFEQETVFRRQLSYPPFGHFLRVVVSHPSAGEAEAAARGLAELAKSLGAGAQPFRDSGAGGNAVSIVGPASAPIPKLHGRFRWHFGILARRRGPLLRFGRELADRAPARDSVQVSIDVDPVSIL